MQYQDNRQLLCTFSTVKEFRNVIVNIKRFYNIYDNRIFTFMNVKVPEEIYLTYNVINSDKNTPKFPNTILIHRKKQTNTLYSLNALNTLIKEENGTFDPTFVIDWELYSNSLVISSDVSVKIIPLKLFK